MNMNDYNTETNQSLNIDGLSLANLINGDCSTDDKSTRFIAQLHGFFSALNESLSANKSDDPSSLSKLEYLLAIAG